MNVERVERRVGFALVGLGLVISGTKMTDSIRPIPVMATWSQYMMRQWAKVTIIPPIQGPGPLD